MMREPKLNFWPYLTYDSDGFINGILDDAPEEMKQAFNDFIKTYDDALKQGIKL